MFITAVGRGQTDILAALTGVNPRVIAERYSGYGALKNDVAEAVITELDPIRRAHDDLLGDPRELDRLLLQGAERARPVAEAVLARAEKSLGLS